MSDASHTLTDPGRIAAARNFDTRTLPHSEEAEEYLLSCCLLDGADVVGKCIESRIDPMAFHAPCNQIIFRAILDLYGAKTEIDLATLAQRLRDTRQFDDVGGMPYLVQVSARMPSTALVANFIETVSDYYSRRKLIAASMLAIETADDRTIPLASITERLRANLDSSGSKNESMKHRLASLAFDDEHPVPEPVAVLSIAGRCVSTAGNLTSIISEAKSGKSAFVGAIIAAMLVANAKDVDADFYEDGEPDTLGVVAAPPKCKFVLHLDTEQSRYHFDQLIRRAKKRARCDKIPPWLVTYGLKGFTHGDLQDSLEHLVRNLGKGNIHAIILDGSADFVEDVNAPDICNSFVAHLDKLAVDCDCPIIGVIHENPRAKNGKGRGHLGAQLERKAESNILLEKDADAITTIYAEQTRGGPILKSEGPRFQWSDEHGMHMSTATKAATKDDAKRAELLELSVEVFEGVSLLSYTELKDAIIKARGWTSRWTEKKINEMKTSGVCRPAGGGKWAIAS